MNQSPKVLYECIRQLMAEVQEQKNCRESMIRAMLSGVPSLPIPTDEEVDARIAELISVQEVKK